MDNIQKQQENIFWHKEIRGSGDCIEIDYINRQAIVLLSVQDTGSKRSKINGNGFVQTFAFRLPTLNELYSPHNYIDHNRAYVRHPKPKRKYIVLKGYLKLPVLLP